jgi:hypothetical protein
MKKSALAVLKREMNRPQISASARTEILSRQRKLELIDPFQGYACDQCGCRFPESASRLTGNATLVERRRESAKHRDREFAAHICQNN